MSLLFSILLFVNVVDGEKAVEKNSLGQSKVMGLVGGYWRFVQEDFRERHPWLPSFMIKRALKTRLFLGDDFIQYRSPKKMIGERRPIETVKTLGKDHYLFERKEDQKKVVFELYRKDDKWFYREGDLLYQLVKDSPDDQLRWKGES
jgi:hypothetical protein